MTSQPGAQTIAIDILPNISRTKGNQTMKLGQLIGYNKKNIFLEISYTEYGGETSPRPFFKKSKLSIYLDQQSKVLYSLYLLHTKLRVNRNILKLSWRSLAFNSYKAFLKKQKEVWNQCPCLIFSMILEEKYLSWYTLLTDQISLSGCFYFVRYWGICVL